MTTGPGSRWQSSPISSRFSFSTFFLSFFALLLAAFTSATVAQEIVPGWHTNLDDACRAAEANGQPLFIVFRCVR